MFSIEGLLVYLKAHPETLGLNKPFVNIALEKSDVRKRFTEFHRIRVDSKGIPPQFFWVRYLKNKPEKEIFIALEKQYTIMCKLLDYFNTRKTSAIHFSCSKPMALLKEWHVLITKECAGTLMNALLLKKIPWLAKVEIAEHFYRVGYWLALFHDCFKEKASSNELSDRIESFKNHSQASFSFGLDFLSNCHRDYSPRNIFVGPNAVEVIDFVGVEKGLPAEDIHFFVEYIRKAKFNLMYSAGVKETLIDAFLEGYQYGASER